MIRIDVGTKGGGVCYINARNVSYMVLKKNSGDDHMNLRISFIGTEKDLVYISDSDRNDALFLDIIQYIGEEIDLINGKKVS